MARVARGAGPGPHARSRAHRRAYPIMLSGGMRQRVLIAMALSREPRLLIADEPGTALDVTTQAQILKLLRDLVEERGLALLMITHNLGVVRETADYVYRHVRRLRRRARADARELFAKPSHPYTRALMACMPKLSGDERCAASTGRCRIIPLRLPAAALSRAARWRIAVQAPPHRGRAGTAPPAGASRRPRERAADRRRRPRQGLPDPRRAVRRRRRGEVKAVNDVSFTARSRARSSASPAKAAPANRPSPA